MSKKQGFRNLFGNPIFQSPKPKIYQNSFENPKILKFFEGLSPCRSALFEANHITCSMKRCVRFTSFMVCVSGLLGIYKVMSL
jgi:hypothetical protein